MDLVQFKSQISKDFLERLSNYNNGILQFSAPTFIKSEISKEGFDDYFLKFIGKDYPEKLAVIKEPSNLTLNIAEKFSSPLQGRIDIDFTIKRRDLPSLFFDFKFDGIGVNGALYAVKSIDLDSGIKIDSVRALVSEYESVLERLISFAKSRDINGDPENFLVMDPPTNKSDQFVELYSLLKNENMPFFKLVSSDELDNVSNLIIKKNAHKISKELFT